MAAGLDDPKLVLERAQEHLDDLYAKLATYREAHPVGVCEYIDEERSLYVMELDPPEPDPKVAIVAGDVIHTVRSALDHLAWQLASLNTLTPFDRTCFPIVYENTSRAWKKFREVTRDVPEDAVREFE